MATAYDPRVTVPLNGKRVIAAGERLLAEQDISLQLAARIEDNLERLRAGLDDGGCA